MRITYPLLRFLVEQWKVETPLTDSDKFGFIFAVSYGTGRERLTDATREITRRAAELAREHPEAVIVVSCCSYIFPGSEDAEWQFRRAIFQENGVPDSRLLRADDMENSIQEAKKVWALVLERHISKRGCVVTGEMHSRRETSILRKIMPDADIRMICVSFDVEWQPDHPVLVQRGPWRWFAANIAAYILWLVRGERLGEIHHRSALANSK
jgi:uncharacterized SAM-binding protein YcdF (DUF218 family)